MWIETIARPMDASEIAVLSMSRMARVQHLDLGSSMMRFLPLNRLRVSKITSGWYETLLSPIEVFTTKLTSGQLCVMSL